MPFCSKCGEEITQDAQFCTNCGLPLTKQEPIKVERTHSRVNIEPIPPTKSISITIVAILLTIFGISSSLGLIGSLDSGINFIINLMLTGASFIGAYQLSKGKKVGGLLGALVGLVYLFLSLMWLILASQLSEMSGIQGAGFAGFLTLLGVLYIPMSFVCMILIAVKWNRLT